MQLLSVNVSMPKEVFNRGRTVETGIFKVPVDGRVVLRTLNLDGDGQADLDNHGGPYRAVYVYTYENYVYWQDTLGLRNLSFGNFGENLTVTEMPEDEVYIGDIFRVGEVTVQVTQPRGPCYKLGIRIGRPDFPKRFLASGRVGFYMRVLKEGEVGAGDKIELIEAHPERMPVREVLNLLYFDRNDREGARRASGLEALTPVWRDIFAKQAAGD